jgi:hypothetical protein
VENVVRFLIFYFRYFSSRAGDIEVVRSKCNQRVLALRVDGETVAQFQPTSALFRCVGATALQKVVLELFFRLCGWSWAVVQFESAGIVVRNANNPAAAYPLSASLRIAVSEPLHRCLCDVRRLQADASKLNRVDVEKVKAPAVADATKGEAQVARRRGPRAGFFRTDDESKQLRLTIEHNLLFNPQHSVKV